MPRPRWFKGNIHTHTNQSDGDESPEKVVRWYRRHGYDFLVLTDHNHLTLLESRAGKRRFRRPVMIPGEEISANIKQGAVPIHINGIGITRVVEPIDTGDVVSTIQANVNAILDAGGIASINHPNYKWAFDHEAISQVTGASMLEVFNGVPMANVVGAPGRPGNEEIWDGVLSSGRAIYGVATDDSHNYKDFEPGLSNPGRGWVVVRSPSLTATAIVDAMAGGEFYASTGVELEDLELSDKAISLRVRQQAECVYTTRFIGKGGVVQDEVVGTKAGYRVRGDEGYVRATVSSSAGTKAWTQPVFVR